MRLKRLNDPSGIDRVTIAMEQFDSHVERSAVDSFMAHNSVFRFKFVTSYECGDRQSCPSTEEEIDCLSDYYSKHAARTFLLNTFHDTIRGDASRRRRFFPNVQVRREWDTLAKH